MYRHDRNPLMPSARGPDLRHLRRWKLPTAHRLPEPARFRRCRRPEAYAWDFPGSIEAAADLLREVLLEHHPVLTGIEKVHAMPKQGVSSTFKFGSNYGSWLGAMSAMQMPHIIVTPAKWQRSLLDSGGGDTKTRSLSMARRLFPNVDLHLKKHHGRSDALLLALYAARWQKQNGNIT